MVKAIDPKTDLSQIQTRTLAPRQKVNEEDSQLITSLERKLRGTSFGLSGWEIDSI